METIQILSKSYAQVGQEIPLSNGILGKVLSVQSAPDAIGFWSLICQVLDVNWDAKRTIFVDTLPAGAYAKRNVVLVLGGKPRNLTFDLNAMRQIEQLIGQKFLAGKFVNLSATELRAFLWSCMVSEDETLTLEEVGAMLKPADISRAFETVSQLMLSSSEGDPRILAPYVPSPLDVLETAFELSELKAHEHFYDLGAGDGRALFMAEKRGAYAVGYEINQQRFQQIQSMVNSAGLQQSIRVVNKDLFEADLTGADVVFLYLLGTSNERLRPKLEVQLKDGARVISHDFTMKTWGKWLHSSVKLEAEGRTHTIYSWRIQR